MCGTCGCSAEASADLPPAGSPVPTPPRPGAPTGGPPARLPSRRLQLEQRLLAHNDGQAAANRDRFQRSGVRVVNLLSAPGSGKTSLLEALAPCQPPLRQAVLVGDLATDNDARRLRAAGLPAVQITTGSLCHLEAWQVAEGLSRLEAAGHPLEGLDLLWIENVGNLVCPAAFDLGEELRLVLLSVGEGEDKPLKYPALFHSADVVAISKIDLAAAVGFRHGQASRAIAQVAPRARIVEISARSGQGLGELMTLLLGVEGRTTAPAA